ncbi:MAG: hypothetical protein MJ241_06845, partial [Bacilli bacterium]|nr:hypothetical protein [Bacilli bacterium]
RYNTVQDEDGNWVTCHGAWRDEYQWTNCYTYAIEDILETGRYTDLVPGDLSGRHFTNDGDVYDVAQSVISDMSYLGYETNVSEDRPESIDGWKHLICLRVGSGFHFMKYNQNDDYWYHKFPECAPLRFESYPDSSEPWIMEMSCAGVENDWSGYTYTGTILYIEFWTPRVAISVTESISAEDYIELSTLYFDDSSNLSFLCDNFGIVGYYYSMEYISFLRLLSYGYACFEITNVDLIINVDYSSLSNCSLYDENFCFLSNFQIENYTLRIPSINAMLEAGDSCYLVPYSNDDSFTFSVQNIYYVITYTTYIDEVSL